MSARHPVEKRGGSVAPANAPSPPVVREVPVGQLVPPPAAPYVHRNAAGRHLLSVQYQPSGAATLTVGYGKRAALITIGPGDRRALAAALLDGLDDAEVPC